MQFEEESPKQYVDIARAPDKEMRPDRPVPPGCGQEAAEGGAVTPRTQKQTLTAWGAMRATGRWRATVRRRSQSDRNAMSDDDRVVANEDLLDYQAHDSLALQHVKRISGAAQAAKETRESLGKA